MRDSREWLEADGLGGFAMGTIDGIRTRRYHATLLAATRPPEGRMVLVSDVEVYAETPGGRFALSSANYDHGYIHPDGATRIVVHVSPVADLGVDAARRHAGSAAISSCRTAGRRPRCAGPSWRAATADLILHRAPDARRPRLSATQHANTAIRLEPETDGERVSYGAATTARLRSARDRERRLPARARLVQELLLRRRGAARPSIA